MKQVVALTGIRSEYDLMYPLLDELHKSDDFSVGVIVCGAHNTALHNYSVNQIESDGLFIKARIENLIISNSNVSKGKSAANLFSDLMVVLSDPEIDYLIVLGDREEPIVGALAATYLGIPIIHLAGGDNTSPEGGDIDEQIRHATTKLSHVHLVMHESHADRVISMGEESWRVNVVGSGGVDRLRLEPGTSRLEMNSYFENDIPDEYVIVIHHALSSMPDDAISEIDNILSACAELGVVAYVGAPNSDPGFEGVNNVIVEHASRGFVRPYKNLPRSEFVTLLKNASCLLGNSSLAFHEAPYLGLQAINVGQRQTGRISGNNLQFVDNSREHILSSLKKALRDKDYRKSIVSCDPLYGDGHMARRSLEIIRNLPEKDKLLAKKNTY